MQALLKKGLAGEMAKYGVNKGSVFVDSKLAKVNVLDMTNPQNLEKFGVTKSMLTDPDNYVTSQIIGKYAQKAGYEGLIYHSSTSEAKHIVFFKFLK